MSRPLYWWVGVVSGRLLAILIFERHDNNSLRRFLSPSDQREVARHGRRRQSRSVRRASRRRTSPSETIWSRVHSCGVPGPRRR